MNFIPHSELEGLHAFLSASKYHWIRYDDEKLKASYQSFLASERGTKLHEYAKMCIELKQKLPASKKTLNMYVNDAIGFRLTPEQPLYFSENCFGTADAIGFNGKLLRIHDLKTGVLPAHMDQLEIYAALFCLEYKEDPKKIGMQLRIYQNDQIFVSEPEPEKIIFIQNAIVRFDKLIDQIKVSEG